MRKRTVFLIVGGIVLVMCFACVALGGIITSSPEYKATATARAISQDTEEVHLTNTLVPTHTTSPTKTTYPTNTPKPTNTPRPTATFTPTPAPVILSGSGDAIVDFDNPFDVAIVHITGNASGRHFAVINYGSDGRQIDLLVNTTDPYDGVRPLDFGSDEHTTRIEVLPLAEARKLTVPGTIEGEGDDVILLLGSKPDLAKIKGNAAGRHFAVIGYGNYSDLLVNTTDPYDGTVILSVDTVVLEIKAEGEWSIEITAKK